MSALSSRMPAFTRALGVLTLAFAPAVALAAEEVDLRPKFEKGEEIKYSMTMNAETASVAPAGSEPAAKQQVDQNLGITLKVKEVDAEKGATVDLVYDSFKITSKGGMMPFEFDSAQPADKDAGNPVAGMFRPIVGKTLTLTINPDGNITNVSGGDSLATGMGAQMLNGYISREGLTGLLGPVFSTKPGKPTASVGETWTHEDTVSGAMKITSTHTLKSVTNKLANVDIKGKIDIGAMEGMPNMTIKDSTYEGSYVWDTGSGKLKSMKTNQSTTIEGGMQPGGMVVKQVMQVTRTK